MNRCIYNLETGRVRIWSNTLRPNDGEDAHVCTVDDNAVRAQGGTFAVVNGALANVARALSTYPALRRKQFLNLIAILGIEEQQITDFIDTSYQDDLARKLARNEYLASESYLRDHPMTLAAIEHLSPTNPEQKAAFLAYINQHWLLASK